MWIINNIPAWYEVVVNRTNSYVIIYNENQKPKTYDIGGTCKIVEAKVFEVQKFTFALQFTTQCIV